MTDDYDPITLVNQAALIVRLVSKLVIHNSLQNDHDRAHALGHITMESGSKAALRIDHNAEERCIEEFRERCKSSLFIIGEESLNELTDDENLRTCSSGKICVLVDMVDGTDLLEMNIPMWCSAIVIVNPTTPKILGAVVGQASGEIYFTNSVQDGSFVSRAPSMDLNVAPTSSPLKGPSNVETLDSATVSFYGQKAKSFLSVSKKTVFHEMLEQQGNSDAQGFRIHTLSGNPFMVKLADRARNSSGKIIGRGIDAVFEISGQYMHDLAPGLFIAKKAGAYACDLDGKEITYESLAEALLTPTRKMKYVLASTQRLADELVKALK